tara:strand:- start:219 stop:425 length:207 start_codon:yes stop_codon:yes gene_type:complete
MNRDDAWVDAVNRRIKMEGKTKHIEVLKTEVDVLASRLEPHDTGNLHTAIHVLKHRVEELEKEIKKDG